MRPYGATRAGTQAPPLPRSVIFFHTIPYKQNSVHAQFTPNEINHPTHHPPKRYQPLHAIHPNETVGAVPACPPERSRSGVSIIKTHALCTGDERRMRPCRATRAGTQAPPLPISVIFFHAIPHKQNTIYTQSTQTKHINNTPHHNNRGRKCIAHSRPLNSK